MRSTSSILPMGLFTDWKTYTSPRPSFPPVQIPVPTALLSHCPPQGTKGWSFQRLPVHAAAGCSVLGVLCKRWPRAGLEVHSDTGIFLLSETREHCLPPTHSQAAETATGREGEPRTGVNTPQDPSTWEVEAIRSEFTPASTT